MKKTIIITLVTGTMILFIQHALFPEGNKIILDIRKKFNIINKELSKYRKIDAELPEHDPSSLVGYFKGKELRKAIHQTGDNMHTGVTEYYFWKGKIFFIYLKVELTPAADNTWREAEDRYYFHNNKMIRWLDKDKKEQTRDNPFYDDQEISMLQRAKEIMGKFQLQ